MAGVVARPCGSAAALAGATRMSGLALGLGPGWRMQPLVLTALSQPRRHASSHRKPRRSGASSSEMSPTVGMAQMSAGRSAAVISFRMPQTFVPPPMAPFLRTPSVFFKLLWYRYKTRVTDYMAELSVRLQSKDGFFKAARYKPNKKQLVPLAKSLHAQMLEATAAGDVAALGPLLTAGHLAEVSGLIARRPQGRRCRWELLAYRGRPRLVDSKMVMIPGPTQTYVRQAVVRIRSRQRFTWTDEKRGTVTSQSERDVQENVVLVAILDRASWETSDWRIFGFMPDTTLASWEAEKDLVDSASATGANIGENRGV